jgi:hypothetical protein
LAGGSRLLFDAGRKRRDAGRDKLLERLVEGVALAPVEIQHRHNLARPGECGAGHALRDAGRCRLRRHAGDKGVEIAAAARGEGGGGEGEGGEEDGEAEEEHEKNVPDKFRAVQAKV